MKPKSKPPGTKRLNLKCDIELLLSTPALKFHLRRYSVVGFNESNGAEVVAGVLVGACQKWLATLNSLSGLVSKVWYRIPFDQS
jgi:hypothetical protein